MRSDNLDSEIDDLRERVRKLETQDPLGNASVRRGSTRFFGNESLKVIGSALVSGWLIITGTLKIVGGLAMEGQSIFSGGVRLLNLNGTTGAANLTIDGAGNLQRSTFPTEGHISNLIVENAAQQLSLNNHESRVTSVEGTNGAQQASLNNHEARMTGAEGRLNGVEGTNGSQQSSLNDHERKINGLLSMNAALRLNIVSLSLRIQSMDGGGPVTPPPNPGV